MPKLKLDLDDIQVDSFETHRLQDAKGTVHGMGPLNSHLPCQSNHASCEHPCRPITLGTGCTNGHTCDGSCFIGTCPTEEAVCLTLREYC
jgi:hypothetical protein